MTDLRLRTPALGLLLASAWLLPAAAGAQSIAPSIRAARTQGVAPLAVHFDATGTRPASSSDDAFHDLLYRWDFDDPGSGTFRATGGSRDEAFGPVAGHVFEKPGTYTVRLTVTDPAGRSATVSQTIRVTSSDALETYCFANDASWSDPQGRCAGAKRIVTSSFQEVMSHVGAGRRLLLRRGDRFTQSGAASLSGSGPGLIGAFGSGAPPVVRQTAAESHFQLRNLTDWRFQDLALVGSGTTGSGSMTYYFQEWGPLRQITLLRIDGTRQKNAVNINNAWGQVEARHDQIAVVNSIFSDFAHSGGKGSGVRFDTERSFFLGNQLLDNEGNEYNFRTQHLDKVAISHNRMERPRDQKGNMTIRACNWYRSCGGNGSHGGGQAGVGDTKQFVISDNLFTMHQRGSMVSLMPQGRDYFEVIREGLIERNHFSGVKSGGGVQKGVRLHASDITIRNNVFDSTYWWEDPKYTGATRTAIAIMRIGYASIPDSSNVRVLNNTHYDRSSWSGGAEMIDATNGSGHVLVNNLLYAPSTQSQLVDHRAGVVREERNLGTGAFSGTPFASQSPAHPADFQLRPSSPARDAGAPVSAHLDYLRQARPAGGAYDVGAFEFESGSSGPPAAPVLKP